MPDEVKVSTGYDIGGPNYLSGSTSRRGYYAYVQPVKRGKTSDGRFTSEQVTLFVGFKELLIEVKRQSQKQASHAEILAEMNARRWANMLAAERGWTLTGRFEDA